MAGLRISIVRAVFLKQYVRLSAPRARKGVFFIGGVGDCSHYGHMPPPFIS